MKLPKWLTLKEDHEIERAVATPGIPYEECQHQWAERLRSYAPPRLDVPASIDNPELLQVLLLGVTTIVDECQLCHVTRKEVLHGSPDPQLDEMLDKVLQYGPQFMQRDGNTFVFQQYRPAPQPVGVPLR
jgi:hypothetical protein